MSSRESIQRARRRIRISKICAVQHPRAHQISIIYGKCRPNYQMTGGTSAGVRLIFKEPYRPVFRAALLSHPQWSHNASPGWRKTLYSRVSSQKGNSGPQSSTICGPSYSSSPWLQRVGFLSPISLWTCELSDLFTPVVVLVDKFTSVKLAFNNQLLTVLGVVLGLVISFRTSSAYERWVDPRTSYLPDIR